MGHRVASVYRVSTGRQKPLALRVTTYACTQAICVGAGKPHRDTDAQLFDNAITHGNVTYHAKRGTGTPPRIAGKPGSFSTLTRETEAYAIRYRVNTAASEVCVERREDARLLPYCDLSKGHVRNIARIATRTMQVPKYARVTHVVCETGMDKMARQTTSQAGSRGCVLG